MRMSYGRLIAPAGSYTTTTPPAHGSPEIERGPYCRGRPYARPPILAALSWPRDETPGRSPNKPAHLPEPGAAPLQKRERFVAHQYTSRAGCPDAADRLAVFAVHCDLPQPFAASGGYEHR